MRVRTALTIAGTDSGGGAGIVADVRTFAALGIWPLCAVTAVTAQDAVGVRRVTALPADDVTLQITTVLEGIGVDAAKTGLLPDATVANAIAELWTTGPLAGVPLVVDPVLVASSGDRLSADDAVAVIRERLVPVATVVTPNLAEAGALLDQRPPATRAGMEAAAAALVALGCHAVVLTGGHLENTTVAADVLVVAGQAPVWLEAPWVDTRATHGTGCVLSAALTAGLARGSDLGEAARDAKRYVTEAIRQGVTLGRGGAVRPS